jgi:hypothetical protein
MAVAAPLWREEGKKGKGKRKEEEVKGATAMFRGSNPSAMGEAAVGHRRRCRFRARERRMEAEMP